MVMPANSTGVRTGYLAGLFPGRIGHLFSPGGQRGPYNFIPYALDNGAFGAGSSWTPGPWVELLRWSAESKIRPLWALVPDIVGDRGGTLERWHKYYPIVEEIGWDTAFAVQDGMTADDVPEEANVVFVGGSTEFKWSTVEYWCKHFGRIHVGRVNSGARLWQCHKLGVESCDGTGWMRGDDKQFGDLFSYLRLSQQQTRSGFSLP